MIKLIGGILSIVIITMGNLILREEFITIPTIDIERLAFTFFKNKLPEQEDRLIA